MSVTCVPFIVDSFIVDCTTYAQDVTIGFVVGVGLCLAFLILYLLINRRVKE